MTYLKVFTATILLSSTLAFACEDASENYSCAPEFQKQLLASKKTVQKNKPIFKESRSSKVRLKDIENVDDIVAGLKKEQKKRAMNTAR